MRGCSVYTAFRCFATLTPTLYSTQSYLYPLELMTKIYLSVVVPVYNEGENLENLYQRLTAALDKLNKPYEIIFTNDGSRDNSGAILNEFHKRRPEQIRVIHFNGNFGQHMAIMAAFERVRGEVIVTLDADLQNPPEEIAKLLAA